MNLYKITINVFFLLPLFIMDNTCIFFSLLFITILIVDASDIAFNIISISLNSDREIK